MGIQRKQTFYRIIEKPSNRVLLLTKRRRDIVAFIDEHPHLAPVLEVDGYEIRFKPSYQLIHYWVPGYDA